MTEPLFRFTSNQSVLNCIWSIISLFYILRVISQKDKWKLIKDEDTRDWLYIQTLVRDENSFLDELLPRLSGGDFSLQNWNMNITVSVLFNSRNLLFQFYILPSSYKVTHTEIFKSIQQELLPSCYCKNLFAVSDLHCTRVMIAELHLLCHPATTVVQLLSSEKSICLVHNEIC